MIGLSTRATDSASSHPLDDDIDTDIERHDAVDLAPHSIRVNCYCPGSIHTQIVDKFLAAAPDQKAMINSMTMTHLVPRMGQPVDVATLVCFLASPESQFVNGAIWTVDGGSLAWRGTLDVLGMEAQS